MKILRSCLVVAIGLLALTACETEPKRAKGEDLTIVVEADRSKINEDEKSLRAKQTAFNQELRQLRAEKERLMSEKEQTIGKDKQAAMHLKELEQRLWQKERTMWGREAGLQKQREQLDSSKDELLGKISRGVPTSGGSGGVAAVASREKGVASRESKIAQRELSLAKRENDLAKREENLAQREADFLKLQKTLAGSRLPAVPRVTPSSGRVSRKQAEQAFKSASGKMRKRGVLWGDLPPELAALQSEFYRSKKSGEFARAKDAVAQLEAALAALVIDSGFIDRKFARLNALIRQKPPMNKKAVSSLLRKATQLVGDGKYQAANRELNKIFALLKG